MDILSPQPVIDAVKNKMYDLDIYIFYSLIYRSKERNFRDFGEDPNTRKVIKDYILRRFNWKIDESYLCFSPGVCFYYLLFYYSFFFIFIQGPSISVSFQGFIRPGQKLVSFLPIYHPVHAIAEQCGFLF
jgi:bifunctional pyridoxal-dependent enzyme with beta-cystathionase and maltose regulon repressor activities